jgi:hypothetical protein
MRNLAKSLGYLVLAVVLLGSSAGNLNAECNSYNAGIQYDPLYGYYCGGSGGGCTECVDGDYNSCVTSGSSCIPHVRHQDF